MRTVRELHDEAMRLSQLADLSRSAGKSGQALEFAREALRLEVEAANRIDRSPESEPTRSILFRSAASIALQARDQNLAERLVIEGLSGYPPPTVYQQLRDLYEEIGFQRHLALRNVELEGDGVQSGEHEADGTATPGDQQAEERGAQDREGEAG